MHIFRSMSSAKSMDSTNAAEILEKMVAKGFLGKKSNKGFYLKAKSFDKYLKMAGFPALGTSENPEAIKIIQEHEIPCKNMITEKLIQSRLMIRFINECLLCFEEGIIERPIDGDFGAVFGIGFPPSLGGPFKMLDLKGSSELYAKAIDFSKIYGNTFRPCQLFKDHSEQKLKFYTK